MDENIQKELLVKYQELAPVITVLEWNYENALKINEKSPNTIHHPIAWALYRTWRMTHEGK